MLFRLLLLAISLVPFTISFATLVNLTLFDGQIVYAPGRSFTSNDAVVLPGNDFGNTIARFSTYKLRERDHTGSGTVAPDDQPGSEPSIAEFRIDAPDSVDPGEEFRVSATILPDIAYDKSADQKSRSFEQARLLAYDEIKVSLLAPGMKLVSNSSGWLAFDANAPARWIWIATANVDSASLTFVFEGRKKIENNWRVENFGTYDYYIGVKSSLSNIVKRHTNYIVDFLIINFGQYADGIAFWSTIITGAAAIYTWSRVDADKPPAQAKTRKSGELTKRTKRKPSSSTARKRGPTERNPPIPTKAPDS
ncbi:hypothetical protein [Shinella sp. DD12]|uniref:hypothetical protein n=1 Tax=Shinella sp. DD12 TaxID=1410620 RepID=UPI0003C53295|nr:hypothetical protein [Shinella sp. DD12]EYR81362.1 hypothetical protein SHLA_15c000470 [Shinella sp. DD12]